MDLRSRNKVNATFSMSSMTDLVFLLLIFFIIVSTLVSPNTLPVDLPTSSNKTTQKSKVSVTVKDDLTHFVNNQVVELGELERAINGAFDPGAIERNINLSVDKNVPVGITVNILEIAKKNKCKIVLRTQPQKQS